MLLDVCDLTLEFHDRGYGERVVENVSFSLDEGEILGIVGESGSGKSMTGLAISGLLPRKRLNKYGEILFDGNNVLTMKREDLRKLQGKDIGVIFQEPMSSLNPTKRIGYQVEEALVIHTGLTQTERKQEACKWLEAVEMTDPELVYSCYPHELSGGMRQRVMIAAAMVTHPRLLIADEPTSALDVTVQAQIVELLKRINKATNVAIMFISHDLSLVKQISDNVIVMEKGHVVEKGKAEKIFVSPKEDYTKKLISAIPVVDLTEKKETVSHADDKALLSVSDLNVEFDSGIYISRKRQVIKDVSFEVKKGEIVGLAGESGSGKTTIAKAILGMIDFAGDIKRPDHAQMVFQDPYGSLNPSKTIGWLLQEPLRLKGGLLKSEREKISRDMLADIGLPVEAYDRKPAQLSGGQRQRLSIGIALIREPELLIADEPVSALDVTIQAQILSLIKDIQQKRNLSILFISHDLRTMYDFCDRIIILKDGKIVEEDAPYELYTVPKHPYTRELVRSAGLMA